MVHVPATGGRSLPVTPGVVDDAARYAYTNGQCHALALELHQATSWPIAYLGAAECCYDEDCARFPEKWGWCQCQVDHVGVLTPDGRFLDIEGPRRVGAVIGAHTDDPDHPPVVREAPATLVAWLTTADWPPTDRPTAATFVPALRALV